MGSATNFHDTVAVEVVCVPVCSSHVFFHQIALFSPSLMLIPV